MPVFGGGLVLYKTGDKRINFLTGNLITKVAHPTMSKQITPCTKRKGLNYY